MEGKDFLLRGNTLDFSIDSIWLENKEKEIFSMRIIPDINTKTFYPFHCRTIRSKAELLDEDYYYSLIKNFKNFQLDRDIDFSSSLLQGANYSIPIQTVPENIFKKEMIFSMENDIFREHITESSYKFEFNEDKNIIPCKKARKILENKSKGKGPLYLYGLKVGQGDTLLVVCTNKSVYLIDLNIYKGNWKNRIDTIKGILDNLGLNNRKINGLIITHKHLDHIRGISEILKNFDIENFLINNNYIHKTKAVHVLLTESLKIKNWVNCNECFDFNEGQVQFNFIHPTINKNDNTTYPNINDSSVCICLKYFSNVIILSGDASHHIINSRLTKKYCSNDIILKVSHHGSITGTDRSLCSNLSPKYSFISSGNNAKFNHPHPQTINELNRIPNNVVNISSRTRGNVEYRINQTGINKAVI